MRSSWLHDVQIPGHRPGRYERPDSVERAIELLNDFGNEAKVIAGGTDLMVELDRQVATPELLIDLTGIPGLGTMEERGERLAFGPLFTHNQAATSGLVIDRALPLAQASLEVGSPALRNRATIVGNVVTASPANDTITALRALDAELTATSVNSSRTIQLADFHTGVRRTTLEPNELVTAASVKPLGPGDRGVWVKLGLRRAQAISVVHVALVLRTNAQGQINECRLALGSVAPTIVTVPAAEEFLCAQGIEFNGLSPEIVDRAALLCREAVAPIDDPRATADYRSEAVTIMIRRALSSLRENSQASSHPAAAPTLGGPSVAAAARPSSVTVGDDVSANVNGTEIVAPLTGGSLLDWLREGAMLTGTKEGCAEGECGACTVSLEGTSVLSCLVPDGRAEGATVVTIEGLAGENGLHPTQQSFIDRAAVQCGYCIPGFVMAAAALTDAEAVDDSQRRLGLSGNLCRCTGYYAIEHAVQDAANPMIVGSENRP